MTYLRDMKISALPLTILLASAILPALPHATALGASSPWASTEGGKLRLIALPPEKDGTVHAVLEIAPDAGFHTYWKVPGSGGIPPQISVKPGSSFTLERVDFPPPRVFADGNIRDFGYDSTVRLPLTLKEANPDQPSTLNLDIFVGLCAQICVPFQTSLAVDIDATGKQSGAEAILVRAAQAALPEQPGEDFRVLDSQLSADGRAVTIRLQLPPGADPDAAEFIASTADGQAFKLAEITKRDGHDITIVTTPVYLETGKMLKGATIDLLVKAAGRAMETSVTPGSP